MYDSVSVLCPCQVGGQVLRQVCLHVGQGSIVDIRALVDVSEPGPRNVGARVIPSDAVQAVGRDGGDQWSRQRDQGDKGRGDLGNIRWQHHRERSIGFKPDSRAAAWLVLW